MPAGGKVSYSLEGEERFAALEWGIPLYEWYKLPRALRIAHVSTIKARDITTYYAIKSD